MLVEHPVDVSVVMPMYNAEKFVGHAVRSVLEQDFPGTIELVAVDDGSSDSSREIVRELALEHPSILVRLISQGNLGVAAARNTGMRYAAGEFVAFLDADDQLMPSFCSDMVSIARIDHADLVIGSRKKVQEAEGDMRDIVTDDVKDFGYSRYRAPFDQDFLADLFWEKEMGNSVWNKLYRRDLLGTFSTAQYYEDYPFNLDYIERCSVITSISQIAYCYRVGTGTSISETRYGGCGWEAQVVGDYIVRQFIERLSGMPLRQKNLEKADKKLLSDAADALDGGTPEDVVLLSNRYQDAMSRVG